MLDLDAKRPAATPKDAATIVLLRGASAGVEVFCVERNRKSQFMGGALVFPGGKVDPTDAEAEWEPQATPPKPRKPAFADSDAHLRALCVAACRETLEEAAILPVAGGRLDDAELLALRAELAGGPSLLRRALSDRGLRLDLAALHPLSRWITPEAESRRYDTRFFLAVAPSGQAGAHDRHETMASFWASPAEVLRRYERNEVQLMPPTHRTLSLLVTCQTPDDAVALASAACLDPIQPRLVAQHDASGDTLALVLPGDPEHEVREKRIAGGSRYVLRGERWVSEDAPR